MPGRIIWITPDRFDRKPSKSTWLEMAKCLGELGWKVTILTGRKAAEAGPDGNFGGVVEWLPAIDRPFVFRISLLVQMARWLTAHARRDDVIVINEDGLWLVPHLKRLGIRYVHLDFRTLPVDTHHWKKRIDRLFSWRLAIKLFGRRVDGYSFITQRLRREVEAEFALDVSDFAIWHSGVNLDRFSVDRTRWLRADDTFRLFYHGSISRKRGLGLVIDAIALGGLPANFEFVIVGAGAEREDLEAQAKRLGVERQILFRGFVPYERVVDEIAKADVCICPLPDRLEWNVSSPLKVFEYMACAKPMILTRIPAHTDTVAEAPFVVWTEGSDPGHFRNAILESIARRDELTTAAVSARAMVKGRYDWSAQAGAFHRYLARRNGLLEPTGETRPGPAVEAIS